MIVSGVKPLEVDMDSYWTIKPTVLIIAPTRELCTQIAREAAKFVFNTDIKIANIYGGSNIRVQRKHACNAHILSCTVGRLKVNFPVLYTRFQTGEYLGLHRLRQGRHRSFTCRTFYLG